MAVDPIIECFSRHLLPEYCQGLDSCAVNTAASFLVESIDGCPNSSLPGLQSNTHADKMIRTFLTSNIYITLYLPEALTLPRQQSYKRFDVLLIVIINNSVGRQEILNIGLLRDAFPYRLVRGIPLKEGVRYPLQSKVGTPPHHLR